MLVTKVKKIVEKFAERRKVGEKKGKNPRGGMGAAKPTHKSATSDKNGWERTRELPRDSLSGKRT